MSVSRETGKKKETSFHLKLDTLEVHDKQYFSIFDFIDFTGKKWKKIAFKFEVWEILVQTHPRAEAFFSARSDQRKEKTQKKKTKTKIIIKS